MGKLQNIGLSLGVGASGVLALNQLKDSSPGLNKANQIVQDSIGKVVDILGNINIQIGEAAPLSDFGIQKIINAINLLGHTFMNDPAAASFYTGIAGVSGLISGWIGGKVSKFSGDVLKASSNTDDRIMKASMFMSGASFALHIPEGLNIGIAAGSYVLSRKIGEKILGEKYSKLLGMASTVSGYGLISESPAITATGMAMIGGTFLWKLKDSLRKK